MPPTTRRWTLRASLALRYRLEPSREDSCSSVVGVKNGSRRSRATASWEETRSISDGRELRSDLMTALEARVTVDEGDNERVVAGVSVCRWSLLAGCVAAWR